MRPLLEDLRQALRALLRRPGPTLLAAGLLALALGASFVVYSWLHGLVLRPYPGVPDADRLLLVGGLSAKGGQRSLAAPDVQDLQRGAGDVLAFSAQDVIALGLTRRAAAGTDASADRVWGGIVAANYFEVLGLAPQLGGFFTVADDHPGEPPRVVLADAFFRRRFAADPAIIGQTIELNRTAFTVVGVAPAGFQGTEVGLGLALWVPLGCQPLVLPGQRLADRGNHWIKGIARLQPGVSRESAQHRLDALTAQLAATYPENDGKRFRLYPVHRSPWGASQFLAPLLAMLAAFVLLVLAAAWANVANLLLVGALGRRRELAVRLALGAGRGALLRQLGAESFLTALLAVGLGTLALPFSRSLFLAFLPPIPFPVDPDLSPGFTGWLVGAALVLATTLVFGLAPLGVLRSLRLAGILRDEGTALAGSRATARLRRGLLIAQVALCTVLLSAAALFVRAAAVGQRIAPGFATEGLLLAAVDLEPAGHDPTSGAALLTRLREELTAQPGIVDVSWSRFLPLDLGGSSSTTLSIDGYTPGPDEETNVEFDRAGPAYFRTLGVPLLAGREIEAADVRGGETVAVVNREMADRYWQGDAVGRVFSSGGGAIRVVGVVEQIKQRSLDEAAAPFFWFAHAQAYRPDLWLAVRTSGDPAAALPLLRSTLAKLDPAVPVFSAKTIGEHLELATIKQRMAASLLGGFGLIALLLVTVGLYGLVAWMVERRTRELAVRAALGAAPARLARGLLAQGARLGLIGAAIGVLATLGLVRLLRSLLLGLSPFDPLAFVGAAAVLIAAILLASWLPARRALALDPATALRAD